MQQREHAGAGYGEQRHGLGEAVDGIAPALIQQQQNRRNQRAGVSDSDPPHEVRDGESPADRDLDAPNADAFGEQQRHGPQEQQQQGESAGEAGDPEYRRAAGQDHGGDLVGNRAEGIARRDHRLRL